MFLCSRGKSGWQKHTPIICEITAGFCLRLVGSFVPVIMFPGKTAGMDFYGGSSGQLFPVCRQ